MFEQEISRRSFLALSAGGIACLASTSRWIDAQAAGMSSKANYPVVVIGAGLGGLCVAAYLSQFGVPTTVVEQHTIPGGYATAFERGDFTFDVSLHQTSLNNGSAARILKELGMFDKLRLIPLPGWQDAESFADALAAQFPSEKSGIRGFVKEITEISDEISRLAGARGVSERGSLRQYPKIVNTQGKTVSDMLGAFVTNPELKDLLASGWGAYGLPPSELSAFYFAVARGGSLRNGACYILPRSQALSDALAETIAGAGGKILCSTAARSIKVKDNAVEGVELQDGRILPAVAVVSNASAPVTFRKMLPPGSVPSDYLERLDGYTLSISTFVVWLGLNRDVREIVKAYRQGFKTGRGIEADYRACREADVEHGPYSMTVYDYLYEGYSKPGKSTVTLLCLNGYEPWRNFESDYRAGRKSAYSKEKERRTNVLIARAEKDFLPGLSSMIEVKESSTPLTNQHFTGNPKGAIYGFNQTPDNSFMNRLGARTPIKGLYLASAWGNPGGGYSGVLLGGEKAFRAMVEDWGGV